MTIDELLQLVQKGLFRLNTAKWDSYNESLFFCMSCASPALNQMSHIAVQVHRIELNFVEW
jgi:hypothetical protein